MGQPGQLTEQSPAPSAADLEAGRRRLVTPDRLRSFFAPRSVALVGASDGSGWARFIVESLRTAGLPGALVPVHRRNLTAFGLPTIANLTELDEPVDLAFAMVPTEAVEGVLEDAATAGIHNMIVLASGYGEGGEEGRQRERRLVELAIERDITLLGPNCLGYVNAQAGSAPFGLHIIPPLRSGPVGIVLQSGALASAVMGFARARAIGISLLTSMGNEAVITAADVIEYLIEDEDTKVIALFLESIRDPRRFTELAGRALEVGKPVVALKVGRSAAGQATALAHTGAVAGDDAVVDAVLRQFGVVRAASLEELLITAGLFGYVTPPAKPRMGVVTASGGACDIIADRAEDEGIDIPDFDASTVSRLEAVLPSFAAVRNPLDVTGFTLADQKAAASGIGDEALSSVTDDAGFDFVFNSLAVPPAEPEDPAPVERRLAAVAATQERSEVPIVHFTTTCTDISDYGRSVLDRHGLHVLGGIEFAIRAVGHSVRWNHARQRRTSLDGVPTLPTQAADLSGRARGPWSEAQSREFVGDREVPVVPAELVDDVDKAVTAADRLGYPVALKICSAQITHKSDIGGVALGLGSPDEVRAAFPRVYKAGIEEAGRVDGVLVSPMRRGGVEMFVGVTVDPSFGPVLAVGLGGVFVEVLGDVSLRALPVGPDEVRRMLDELRGVSLLTGARGTTPADLDRLSAVIVGIADSALALGDALQTLEINPLWVEGAQIEALDVLVVTTDR
jgi:acyl-CoA synthetase (NDP forming)